MFDEYESPKAEVVMLDTNVLAGDFDAEDRGIASNDDGIAVASVYID